MPKIIENNAAIVEKIFLAASVRTVGRYKKLLCLLDLVIMSLL